MQDVINMCKIAGGFCAGVCGQHGQALGMHKVAQDCALALHGPQHLVIAGTLNNMAMVYTEQGKYEQALEAYSKSLDIKIKLVGQDSPDVADTKYNMAILHKKRGESKVAKQLWLECQAIYAKVFGADHSKTAGAAQQARDCA